MISRKIKFKNIYYFLPGILFCLFFIFISSFKSSEGRIFTLSDDVMISMTYAKTFVGTGELIWYEGGPRVQGFTNLLYTIFLSIIHLLRFDLATNSLIVSLINLVIIFFISLKVTSISLVYSNGNKKISYFLGGLIPFQYPLVFWSLRGFEVGIISLIVIIVVDLLIKLDQNNLKLKKLCYLKIFTLLSIGILIRIDFLIIYIGVGLYLLIFQISNFSEFLSFIKYNLIGAATFILLLLFQHLYYGDFLPNTYYLKTDGFYLIEKIPRGILSSFNLLPLLIFVLFYVSNNINNKNNLRKITPVFFITFFLIIYNILIGGDAWEVYGFANRFLTPIIPIVFACIPLYLDSELLKNNKILNLLFYIFLLSSIFLIQLKVDWLFNFNEIIFSFGRNEIAFIVLALIFCFYRRNKIIATYVIAILFTIFLSLSNIQYIYREEVQITSIDHWNALIGTSLNEVTEPSAKVAIFWAGNIPYYMDRTTVDLLGKSDRYIAKNPPVREAVSNKYNFSDFMPGHNKWDFKYSIGELDPDVITRSWPDPEFYKQLEINNYKSYCIKLPQNKYGNEFPIYVKNNSKNINYDKLVNCSDQN